MRAAKLNSYESNYFGLTSIAAGKLQLSVLLQAVKITINYSCQKYLQNYHLRFLTMAIEKLIICYHMTPKHNF